ncbi:MAG: Kinesin light chain-like protein [uncultured bacterium]|nr:MAG: Kinesin light chain-like protein [uncultured bacterium]
MVFFESFVTKIMYLNLFNIVMNKVMKKSVKVILFYFLITQFLCFSENIEEFNKKIVALYSENKIPEALTLGDEKLISLKQREDVAGKLDASSLMVILSVIYRKEGNFKKVEELLTDAMNIREKSIGLTDNLLNKILYNLASLYKAQKRFSDSEVIYDKTLKSTEEIYGARNSDVANVARSYSEVKISLEKYEEALALLNKAKEIIIKENSENHYKTAEVLIDLGLLFEKLKKYNEAEENFLKSIAICEKVGGDKCDISIPLKRLALIYKESGEYSKSESFYKRVLAIREKGFGENDLEVADILHELGVVCSKQKKADAITYLNKSKGIYEKLFGENHANIALVLSDIEDYYDSIDNKEEAEVSRKKSEAILLKTNK